MREIVFKNFTLPGSKSKNISVTEILRKNNILVESCRETKYLVHDSVRDEKLIKNYSCGKNEIYILKKVNPNTNTKKFSWKIKGKMSCKYEGDIFLIDYEHSFSLEIVNLKKAKERSNEATT